MDEGPSGPHDLSASVLWCVSLEIDLQVRMNPGLGCACLETMRLRVTLDL